MKVYNTGKVQIGGNYFPDHRPYHDKDALLLQDALLNRRAPTFWGRVAAAIWRWL
jgi:hypothetical protein